MQLWEFEQSSNSLDVYSEMRRKVYRMLRSLTLIPVGLAAAGLVLAAPAGAAPTGPSNAQQTIDQLQSEGYRVITTKVGAGSIDQCSVSGVRPGRDITELRAFPRGNTQEVVRYTTVYVDLACAR